MKKVFAATLVTVLLAASTAFAFEVPATQPIKGIEGPDVQLVQTDHPQVPVKGIEGPDVQ